MWPPRRAQTPTSYTAFTQTNPVGPAGGSLALFTTNITGINELSSRNDNLNSAST